MDNNTNNQNGNEFRNPMGSFSGYSEELRSDMYTGYSMNGQMPNGQMPNGQMPNGQMADGNIEGPKTPKSHFGLGVIVGILSAIVLGSIGMVVFVLLSSSVGKATNDQTPTASTVIIDSETSEKINEIQGYLDYYYNGEINRDDIINGMYSGMVSGIGDPYTVYYTKEEYEDLQIQTTGTFYGIGAGLTQNQETMIVTITKVYEGTPAEEAGIQSDDIIVSVDGTDATSMEVSELVQLIRGEEGTKVNLEIYRSSTGETFKLDVERRNVVLPSVEGELVDGNKAYIQISEFQSNTADQFKEIYENLVSQGATSLIVDLRDNPGGLLDSVVDILDYILPEGKLVYTEDKYGKQQVYESDASCIDIPMVVLINGNSASASEIFAGAIKDYEYGTLIGTKSFGKGIVQSIFELSDGDAIKITIAKYFTPNGNYIHGVGIEPDMELEYEYSGDKNAAYDRQYDNQFQKAVEVLNE